MYVKCNILLLWNNVFIYACFITILSVSLSIFLKNTRTNMESNLKHWHDKIIIIIIVKVLSYFFTLSPNTEKHSLAYSAKCSAVLSLCQPPYFIRACGRSQWYSVTIGTIPASSKASIKLL